MTSRTDRRYLCDYACIFPQKCDYKLDKEADDTAVAANQTMKTMIGHSAPHKASHGNCRRHVNCNVRCFDMCLNDVTIVPCSSLLLKPVVVW